MDKEELIRKINRIENQFDVGSLTYKGIRIWPAVRAYLQLQPTIAAKNKKKRFSDYLRDPLYFLFSLFYCFIIDGKKNHNRLKQSKHLFIFDSSAKLKQGDEWINKFAEPLFGFIPDNESYFFIEYSLSQKMWVKRHSKSYLLNPYYLFFLVKSLFRNKQSSSGIKNFDALQEILVKEKIDLNLRENILVRRMEKIIRFKGLFLNVLDKVQPKVVYTSVYYANISLGLTLAANERGIKTVEIQHGQQGDFHPAYSNWENYPKEKYKMHPDVFWMWGKSNVERIHQWSQNSEIEVLNGGNPWLNYYFNGQKKPASNLSRALKLEQYHKRILVSLQLTETFLNSFIAETIANSSDDLFWLIRLHPNQLSYKDTIEDHLKKKGCSNYEIERSTSTPLYEVFSVVDYNITFWSTVAYEAQLFNVKNIIAHPNGKLSMNDYIEKGIFAYADSQKKLESIIDHFDFKEPENHYMDYEDKFLENAMMKINQLIH